jgi:hypothetical protein
VQPGHGEGLPGAGRLSRSHVVAVGLVIAASCVAIWGLTRSTEVVPRVHVTSALPVAAASSAFPGGSAPAPSVAPSTGEGCFFEDHGQGDYQLVVVPQGKLFVRRPAVEENGSYVLLVHFHAGDAVKRLLTPDRWDFEILTVDVGDGAGVYRSLLSSRGFFPALIDGADRAVSQQVGRAAHADRIILSSFSAGYAAAVQVAGGTWPDRKVVGIVLLDSIHAPFAPERGKVPIVGAKPEVSAIAPFVEAARRARDESDGFFLGVTHTGITTTGYASTTECCAALLGELGEKEAEVGRASAGEIRGPVTSELVKGKLVVRGYGGDSPEAHCDQIRLLPGLLRELRGG